MSKLAFERITDRIDSNNAPQFIFLDGELLMPMPNGEFLFFPRGYSSHVYLSKEDTKELLRRHCGDENSKLYAAGNIMMPKSSKT